MIEEDSLNFEELVAAELEEKALVDDATEAQEGSGGYFTTIAKQICETYERLKRAKKEKIVLVLGISGVGKSTLINYLLGCDMQRAFDDMEREIAIPKPGFKDKVFAKMGYNLAKSKTKRPTVYKTKDKGFAMFAYCDCQGFRDTGGKVAQITTSFGIQIAVSLARQVEAIVIIIPWTHFSHETKCEFVKNLSSIIAKLLNNFKGMNKSILFMINHLPKRIRKKYCNDSEGFKELMVENINTVYKAEYKRFCKLKQNIAGCEKEGNKKEAEKLELEQEDIIKTLLLLTFMKTCEISMLDVFDSTRRKSVLDSLLDCNPIKGVSNFNFACDDARKKFDRELYKFANRGIELIQNLNSLPEQLEEKEQLIQTLEKSLMNLNKNQKDVKLGCEIAIQKMRSNQKTKQQEIEENNKKIVEIDEKLAKQKKHEEQLQKELQTLDSNEAVYYEKGSPFIINEERFYQQFKWGLTLPKAVMELITHKEFSLLAKISLPLIAIPIGLVVHPIASTISLICRTRKKIEYKDIPFIKTEENYRNGELLKNEGDVNKKEGKYNAIYESNRGKAGFAQVKIYVEKRLLPENKARIEGINTELDNLEETKKNYESDKKNYKNLQKTLQEEIYELQRKEKLDKKAKLKKIESRIKKTRQALNEVNSELNTLRQKQETTTQAWNSQQTLFKAIAMIIRCIGYNEKVCQVFLKEYEGYMNAQKLQDAEKRASSEVKAPPLSSHPYSFHATNTSVPTEQQPDGEAIPTMAPNF